MKFDFLVLAAVASASTLTPNVLPLFVRNPYLSTWLGSARKAPWEDWPMFWTGSHLGFSVMASIPDSGKIYPLIGRPHDSLRRGHKLYSITFPEYLGPTFDASTTNLTYLLHGSSLDEPVKITLSFLSPITPSSTLRQSIPAAYLTIIAEGCSNVTIYTDANGEWVSGNRANEIKWDLHEPKVPEESSEKTTPIKTWKWSRQTEQHLTEFYDHAEWGTMHFTGPADAQHEAGTSGLLRQHFAEKGYLRNQIDRDFRRIMQEEPVFAFAKTFKLAGESKKKGCSKAEDSAVFTFALIQDPVVQFASARGLTLMKPFWASHFASPDELVRYHYNDFKTASWLARNYSDSLARDAFESGSESYQDIAALSARQVLGATQFSGTPDDPIIFLKEISSNGNFQTVDVIFPAFPFFLYTNPKWLGYLLEPLLEHQLSGQYPNDYSMHDLGAHFPNATGHSDGNDEYMPVEECGNMLIMGLALANAFRYDTEPAFVQAAAPHAVANAISSAKDWSRSVDRYGFDLRGHRDRKTNLQTTGSKAAEKWLTRSYSLWKQWTGYLVRESLIPHNQLCTDDFAGWLANQTNLALKGIIGIKAMSEIADIVGHEDEAKHYRKIAATYIDKWQEYGISRDQTHAKLAYTWYGSWTTIYNLYADSLLCFHVPSSSSSSSSSSSFSTKVHQDERRKRGFGRWFGTAGDQKPIGGGGDGDHDSGDTEKPFIPDKVYQMQSDWYSAVLQKYGLPLDSRHLYTKSDWEFFAAAVTGKKTRMEMLEAISLWVNETVTDRPLTDLYETEGNGGYPGIYFMARPVVGGHFAFLALERACGGKAVEALRFMDEEPAGKNAVDVDEALKADMLEAKQKGWVGDL
ncbi:DUF1793-domain-containing protein [Neurospora crassa]|uniref:Glutaminase A n=2 Tax=Neurospora crassa TaxID=5141 RepID=Q1K7P3_NEUCR|nr:glutaminase A [Neurospora crassa OR74A]EAA32139.1 glutaminase A [Neurospora crassa OR74A]KHE88861.1 DUF1793-domain-containing protein [Neurospora crassa]CAC18168.1 related to glutaminase A [Neurospora crassa]|eukprot:XP_961375.1 glutaminase A [Neurospora crassa OR74A]